MERFVRMKTLAWLLWGYIRVFPQLMIAGWKVSGLPHPTITIFGGGRLELDSPYARQAQELARRLATQHISVMTGGGPGIMEAASCGARVFSKGKPSTRTMGISVRGIYEVEPINPCVTDFIMTDYFGVRKYLLMYYSHAYVIFPGGFGTLDEFAETITLMQTHKLPILPVILYGTAYWKDLILWIDKAVAEGFIPVEHAAYVIVTDDLDEIASRLITYCFSPECERWQHRNVS